MQKFAANFINQEQLRNFAEVGWTSGKYQYEKITDRYIGTRNTSITVPYKNYRARPQRRSELLEARKAKMQALVAATLAHPGVLQTPVVGHLLQIQRLPVPDAVESARIVAKFGLTLS